MQKSRNDPELQEWLDALTNIISEDGNDRASFILGKLASKLTELGTIPHYNLTTPFRNSIPVSEEAKMPGDLFMERKIRSLIRWNALALVLRANKNDDDLGGHISTFSSAATLYDVGFNYFFRGWFSLPTLIKKRTQLSQRPPNYKTLIEFSAVHPTYHETHKRQPLCRLLPKHHDQGRLHMHRPQSKFFQRHHHDGK